jgi:hypothetical protein
MAANSVAAWFLGNILCQKWQAKVAQGRQRNPICSISAGKLAGGPS